MRTVRWLSARRLGGALKLSLVAFALCSAMAEPARAQHEDIVIYSTSDGGGSLVGQPAPGVNPVFKNEALCFPSACLFATTDPGIRTPDTPEGGLFPVAGGTEVSLEVVALDAAVTVNVGSTTLDAPGESASLGSATSLHIHPLYQIVVPESEVGQYAFSFRFTAAGHSPSATYDMVLSNEPEPTPTPSPSPSPTATPVSAVEAYLLYKAKPSKLAQDPDNHRFPKDFNVSLDDVLLENDPAAEHPDDPENYTVKSAGGLLNPASVDGEPVAAPDVHYLRYALKESKEGVGPVDSRGKFPKAVKAPARLFEVENRLGTLFVETRKASGLLLPAGSSELGVPGPVGDQTHYVCHKAKASKLPSQQAPDNGNGKGTFRKDLQVFAKDVFDDCADTPGGAASFPGTSVEGACLLDLKSPRLLCAPVAKSAVEPPRVTTAVLDASFPSNVDQTLLCYAVKLGSKVRSDAAAALSGVPLNQKVPQAKHVQRSQKAGGAVHTAPSNGFPSPVAVDTKALELLCLPTDVLSSTNLD